MHDLGKLAAVVCCENNCEKLDMQKKTKTSKQTLRFRVAPTKGSSAEIEPNRNSLDGHNKAHANSYRKDSIVPFTRHKVSTRVVAVEKIDPPLVVKPVMSKRARSRKQKKVQETPAKECKRPPFRLHYQERHNWST
jgi:hypothetical protein